MFRFQNIFKLVVTITIIIVFLSGNLLAGDSWSPKVGQKVRVKTSDSPDNFIEGIVANVGDNELYIVRQRDFRIDRIIDTVGNVHTFPYTVKYDPNNKIRFHWRKLKKPN